MKSPTRILTLVCFVLGARRVEGQQKYPQYEFRVWQFLPDSSRTSPGGISGTVSGDEDFHMYIALDEGPTPTVRLDGDFVAHQGKDSTMLVGDITATRILSRNSTRLFARDPASEEQVERRSSRLRTTIARGEPVWFYPFGVPRRGERGIAFELTSSDRAPRQELPRDTTRYLPPPGFMVMEYGIEALKRPHRARIRLEVGDTVLVTVFQGEVLTRIPVRLALARGAASNQPLFIVDGVPIDKATFSPRGDLMFELEAQDRTVPGRVCWRWFWADERPPGGSACGLPGGKAVEQSLYGSAGLKIRVTLLSPS